MRANGQRLLIGYNGVDPTSSRVRGEEEERRHLHDSRSEERPRPAPAAPRCRCSSMIGPASAVRVEGCYAREPLLSTRRRSKGKVKARQGLGAGKIIIENDTAPRGASVCAARWVDVTIPIKETKKGPKDGKASLSLSRRSRRTRPRVRRRRSDKDKLNIVCTRCRRPVLPPWSPPRHDDPRVPRGVQLPDGLRPRAAVAR
jgi:hypothetical protein